MLIYLVFTTFAEVVELADAPDSKSGEGDFVRVQVPPSAPKNKDGKIFRLCFFAVEEEIGNEKGWFSKL